MRNPCLRMCPRRYCGFGVDLFINYKSGHRRGLYMGDCARKLAVYFRIEVLCGILENCGIFRDFVAKK